ncbi:sigma-70 family RNA polymerase sigma factor [Aerococcaceae bacterium WGS1372]
MTNQQLELLIKQYNRLIHKVLLACGQYGKPNYEDYYQELSIKLIELADQFNGDPLDQDRYQFANYARKALTRYLIDFMRRERLNKEDPTLTEYIFETEDAHSSTENLTTILNEISSRLNLSELNLVKGLVSGITLKELANQLGVSRKTISKRRGQIQKKLEDLWEGMRG